MLDILVVMPDETDGSVEEDVPPEVGDLEESLMDAMAGDDRFESGTPNRESSNVLDFIQMNGLAGRVEPRLEDPLPPSLFEDEPPPIDPISFFEEGIGDVDASMDPMPPIVPELEGASQKVEWPNPDEPLTDSVQGLKEIISELTHGDSEPEDLEPTLGPSNAPVSIDGRTADGDKDEDEQLEAVQRSDLAKEDRAGTILEDNPDQLHFKDLSGDTDPDSPVAVGAADEGNAIAISSFSELAEAKTLLDRLDLRKTAEDIRLPSRKPARSNAVGDAASAVGEAAYEDVRRRSSRRHSQHRRRRRIKRWLVRLMMLAVLGGAAYGVAQFFLNQTESPEMAFSAAEKLLDEGKYAHASNAFQAFTRRFPMDIKRSDAMFMAGLAMQLAPPVPKENARKAYEEALVLLERFIVENPSHAKTARAETLMGVLYFKLDRHSEAIGILGDPGRHLRDPGVYLITLRTLGRSYAAVSRIESAHSAFMRAASLEENISPDRDYVELGSLYQKLAERSATEEEKQKYEQLAIEQWDYALRVPGLLKSRRDDIKLLRDVFASRLDGDAAALKAGTVPSVLGAARGVQGGTRGIVESQRSRASQPEDSSEESG